MQALDITNQTFGRLTAITKTQNYPAKWLCKCICGNTKEILQGALRSGVTKSCGCLKIELLNERKIKHGDTGKSLHNVWIAMRQRCSNPNNAAYSLYGGRGIQVCPEWNDYTLFKEWALNNAYEEGLYLDKINNDLGYFPENCRWVTSQTNSRNIRKNPNSSSKYKGIHYNKRRSAWTASITVANRKKWIGDFKNEQDAVNARKQYIKDNKLIGFPEN